LTPLRNENGQFDDEKLIQLDTSLSTDDIWTIAVKFLETKEAIAQAILDKFGGISSATLNVEDDDDDDDDED
jgi:hypothetical protein